MHHRLRRMERHQHHRLREVEERLQAVEGLHREAAREREAAAALRHAYEARLAGAGRAVARPLEAGLVSPAASSSSSWREEGAKEARSLVGARGEEAALIVTSGETYVLGEEWWLLYPQFEHDLRFNAHIDICLALELPRSRVRMTELSVDLAGLRLGVAVQHNDARLPHHVLVQRLQDCPFRMLQRMYAMRRQYEARQPLATIADVDVQPRLLRRGVDPNDNSNSDSNPSPFAIASWWPHSRGASRRGSEGPAAAPHRPWEASWEADDCREAPKSFVERDVSSLEQSPYRRQFTQPQEGPSQGYLEGTKRHISAELQQRVRERLEHPAESEAHARSSLLLSEAKKWHSLSKSHRLEANTTSISSLLESERIARATIELGAARQMQVFTAAHRRQMALFRLIHSERERRHNIVVWEEEEWRALEAMVLTAVAYRAKAEPHAGRHHHHHRRAAHDTEPKTCAVNASLPSTNALAQRLSDIGSDEKTARAAIMSDELSEFIELLCKSPVKRKQGSSASLADGSWDVLPAMLKELMRDEEAQRQLTMAEERRRHGWYCINELEEREVIRRARLEDAEQQERNAILDAAVRQSRKLHERRFKAHEHLSRLLSEEEFYRQGLLSDAKNELEAIGERFVVAWSDLLAATAESHEADELTPRRHYASISRAAKPFHYMTYSPEDMDYAPSAQLAVEGILGCAVNKNLEVTRVLRPLRKHAEEDEEQFQAGDMILDVAGHSLHSLSHLREVLSNRCVQIQTETRDEFSNVPEEELTLNPALQKYLELLCEHHNFLVLVLRGCNIYQIIVKT